MLPKIDRSASKATSSTPPSSVLVNSLLVGSGTKLRTVKLNNVVNKVLLNPETFELKPRAKDPVPLTSVFQHQTNFILTKYRDYCNLTTVASYLSRSRELKDEFQKSNLVLTTAAGKTLTIVKDLNDSDVENVVSFNKACAIMSAGILKHTFLEVFDWTKKEYVQTTVEGRSAPDITIINKLAGAMGLQPGNPYYWMIVPGYEFLYELYPAEVVAYTLVRLEFRSQLNIPTDMTDADIISSLVMKMNRIHALESTSFDEAINIVGEDNIRKAYLELARDVGTTSKTRRNDEAILKFKQLITNFGAALHEERVKAGHA
uniref:Nucleocapsid protein n=1 Tax=blackberry leaf mottle-associated virus TaxID=3070201 RepID=A0A482E5W8_9VIRU|nr:nucleocapsid protein [blackberry leaf mottle-associated virus]